MKVIMYICAAIWALNFIGLFLGVEPSKVSVGVAYLLTALFALDLARNRP
jgi:hypothetical protein